MAKTISFIPSILAFEKKIVVSDGLLAGGSWGTESFKPLHLREKSVRGTISNFMKNDSANDVEKLYAKAENANLQTVDACFLPAADDTLRLTYSVKLLPVSHPSSCNSPDFNKCFMELLDTLKGTSGFKDLGRRYAENIASGRTLWRNRVGAGAIKTVVEVNDETFTFDGLNYSLRSFSETDEAINKLGKIISDALCGLRDYTLLRVTIDAKIGNGQEVYPSEELVFNKEDSAGKSKKSKILYSVDGVAGMHSQKVSNAIHTIDTWYPAYGTESGIGPIASGEYGAVTNIATVFRGKKPDDFYSKFYKAVEDKSLPEADVDYVLGVLVRGGVFGKSADKK